MILLSVPHLVTRKTAERHGAAGTRAGHGGRAEGKRPAWQGRVGGGGRLGWGRAFGRRRGLGEKGDLCGWRWRPPARTYGGNRVAEGMGLGGQDPGRPRSWTGLQQRNLSLGALPLPNSLVLKSPRHLRLQEGKEPEKQLQTIWICFLGLKKKKNPSN